MKNTLALNRFGWTWRRKKLHCLHSLRSHLNVYPFSVNIYFECDEINMIGPHFPESCIFVKNICALALNKLQREKMVSLESAVEGGFVCFFVNLFIVEYWIQMFNLAKHDSIDSNLCHVCVDATPMSCTIWSMLCQTNKQTNNSIPFLPGMLFTLVR